MYFIILLIVLCNFVSIKCIIILLLLLNSDAYVSPLLANTLYVSD